VSAATLALRRVSPRRLAGEALRRMSPQFKRRLLALTAACIVLTALYQLWFRDSSLVVVDKVQVTGLTTSDSARVRAALTSAGKTMTTLHVDHGALERAVEAYPVVRTIEVQPDFPHGLSIHVIEYRPAAIAISGSTRLPVAGDGTVLRGIRLDGRLPRIDVSGSIGPKALLDPVALGAAAVAGTAPGVLRSRIDHIERTSNGYVDLRLPGRPAVGGLAAETVTPVAPAGEIGLTSTTPTPTTDGTATTPTDSSTAGTDPAQAAPDATQPLDQTPTAPTTGTPVTPPSTTSQGGAAVAP
jgi:POTRA domain-containing FtsQ-type protein